MRSSIDPTFGDLIALRLRMMKWALRMTGNTANAEDLVQTTLIRMLANRHIAPATLPEIDPWARVVMLNEFRTERRRHRPLFVSLDDLPLAAVDNPETETYCRQLFRMCLGLDPTLLIDPEGGHRWDPDEPKTITARRRRFRARREIQRVAA